MPDDNKLQSSKLKAVMPSPVCVEIDLNGKKVRFATEDIASGLWSGWAVAARSMKWVLPGGEKRNATDEEARAFIWELIQAAKESPRSKIGPAVFYDEEGEMIAWLGKTKPPRKFRRRSKYWAASWGEGIERAEQIYGGFKADFDRSMLAGRCFVCKTRRRYGGVEMKFSLSSDNYLDVEFSGRTVRYRGLRDGRTFDFSPDRDTMEWLFPEQRKMEFGEKYPHVAGFKRLYHQLPRRARKKLRIRFFEET